MTIKSSQVESKSVLICGDRNWADSQAIRAWLSKLQDWGYDTVIEGEARGADTIARDEAKRIGFIVKPYHAKWDTYGRAAGHIRNTEMLKQKPSMVVAFHNSIETSKGTKNCIEQARKLGIICIVVKEEV